jgi:hypothetical protein
MIFAKSPALFVFLLLARAGLSFAAELPVCSNRIINQVTARTGCTVGDAKCWLTKGGFCTDYVNKKTMRSRNGSASQLVPVSRDQVKSGFVAQFLSRAHYAYVENVVRDRNGKPVAVNLSEYNYGTCWVDEESMVTDKYMVVNKRSGIAIDSVDGGFLKPRHAN